MVFSVNELWWKLFLVSESCTCTSDIHTVIFNLYWFTENKLFSVVTKESEIKHANTHQDISPFLCDHWSTRTPTFRLVDSNICNDDQL